MSSAIGCLYCSNGKFTLRIDGQAGKFFNDKVSAMAPGL